MEKNYDPDVFGRVGDARPDDFGKSTQRSFEWILNEDLLRDEGAIYGLSESDPSEKLATIRSFFGEKISELQTRIELREAQMLENEETAAKRRIRAVELKEQYQAEYTGIDRQSHLFYRYLAGLIVYGAVIVLSFWLVYQWMAPRVAYPLLMTLGVYMFGSLSLFNNVAFFYQSRAELRTASRREFWKIWLEEIGIPVIAAAFVIFWGFEPGQWINKVVLFLLLLFVFLFAGKAFLSALIGVQQEFQILRGNRLKAMFRRRRLREIKAELIEVESDIKQLEQESARLREENRRDRIRSNQYERDRESKVSYFLSEYRLAKTAKASFAEDPFFRMMH